MENFESQSDWVYIVFGLAIVLAIVLTIIGVVYYIKRKQKNMVDVEDSPDSIHKDIRLTDEPDGGKRHGAAARVHGPYRGYQEIAPPIYYTSESDTRFSTARESAPYPYNGLGLNSRKNGSNAMSNPLKKKRRNRLDETGQPIRGRDRPPSYNDGGRHQRRGDRSQRSRSGTKERTVPNGSVQVKRTGSREAIISVPDMNRRAHTPKSIVLTPGSEYM